MAIDLYNLILTAKIQKGEGGGGDIDVDALNVTENGTYTASSGHAFSPVSVNVPQGVFPSGTSQITSNGIYDITNFASASVNVPIPSGYIQPTGTSSITENGIYDITSFASVDVNVSGGGGGDHDAEDAIVSRTISGVYENSRATSIGIYAFYGCSALTTVSFPNVTSIGGSVFRNCGALTTVSFPNVTSIGICAFYGCSALTTVSFPNVTIIYGSAFYGCSQLMSLYLMLSSVASLSNANAFANTPMSNSTYTGAFGSIYVPASLVNSYKTATNWSALASRITSYVE